MELKTGEKAPHFSLRDHNKSLVSLEDFGGRQVLLLFFPFAFSSVCTSELCQVNDEFSQYEALDATVIAISVDSPYTLGRFRSEYNYTFILLSDFNKEVSRSYGALHEHFAMGLHGVSKRAAFVIDKNGVIKHQEIMNNPGELPNFARIKEVLARSTK